MTPKPELDFADIKEYIGGVSDEELRGVSFSMPWQYDSEANGYKDPDGFDEDDGPTARLSRTDLQRKCWEKFHQSPQINTAVRGVQGRLTGLGFSTTSSVWEIQQIVEEIETDFRNRLYTYWPKYVGRSYVEGELFQMFTIHKTGFVEVDFMEPLSVSGGGDGDSGIIFHPKKSTLPLFYNIDTGGGSRIGRSFDLQVPSRLAMILFLNL